VTRVAETAMADAHMDAAVDWLMRRSFGPQAEADDSAFEAWLAQAPEHHDAYLEAERIWTAAAAAGGDPRVQARRQWVLQSVKRGRVTRRALAAGFVAGMLGLGGAGLYVLNAPRPLATQAFKTDVGQQATVTLPDGSQVTLNTDTVVRTHADRERRLVYLDRGQAFFRVAKDRRHPFVVTAAGRTVTALGTAFDVRVDRGALKVVLVEGKVRVESAKPAPIEDAAPHDPAAPEAETPMATDMSAGSQLVAPDDADWRLTRTDVDRETSWLHRQIVFDDEALGDIVMEMNRYSTRKMVIADQALARERLSGIYTVGDLHAFSEALKGYGVAELKEAPSGEIRVVALK
jgi:transmembrane sensor